MKVRLQRRVVIPIFFYLFLLNFYSFVFAAQPSDDIAVLKKEVESLKQECRQYKDLNAKLESRLEQLEKKINSVTTAKPAQPEAAVPQTYPVAKARIKRVEENQPLPSTLMDQPVCVSAAGERGEPAATTVQTVPGTMQIPAGTPTSVSGADQRGALAMLTDDEVNRITEGFSFGAFYRAGYGFNSRGGKMQAFQAPLAPSKYRLGNEQDTYLEAIFAQNNWNPNPDSVTFRTQIRVSYQTQQNKSEDNTNSVCLREMYGQMGNFIESNPELIVWAGERFYRLPELDLTDFWWYDLSGYGGGFENIKVGNLGKLNVAYLGYSSQDVNLSTNRGRINKNNLSFILKEVKVPGGTGTFWINGGYINGGSYEGTNYPSVGGADIGFMHNAGGQKNNNQFSFQSGFGACTSLSTAGNIPSVSNDQNSWTVRLTDMLNRRFNDRVSMQVIGLYQFTDTGYSTQAKQIWGSFGLRPVIGITKHFAIEFEPGIDYINSPRNNYDTFLMKFTTSLRLAPGADIASHPRFRLYATYARWGDDFKGYPIGGEGYRDKTQGLNFGVQAESWW